MEKNETISIGADRTETVAKNETLTVNGNRTMNIGRDDALEVGGSSAVQIAKDDNIQVGKKFSLSAADQIQLQTGDASIVLKKDGTITIKGKDITISGSGKINIKASSDIAMKGSKISQN